ncbi:MAG TPA: extracellular solute-binding protein, partial [Anaerolineae bacterium]|nr:extracellular solute-binding protein [Anaerolineae bacterium]
MKTHQGHTETARLLSRREVLKLLGWGAGALASASLLPACGPASPAEEVEAPAPSEPIVLRYQNHWSKETDAHYEGMNWLYKEFPAQYPDITIENVLNPDSAESHKKILADCAAGDCPDVIHGPEPSMWESGYLLDLTSYIEDDPAWKEVLISNTLYSTDGHVWALNGEFSPMPTIWNTRILESAGVGDIPTTWDELVDACDKIKASGKLATSWGVGGVHQWHNAVVSQEGGIEALAADQFDAPQILEAFKRLKLFVDNGWIPDNEIELTWQQSVALFVAEETAFYLNGAWTIGNEITGAGAAPDLKDFVKFAPYPAVGENGTTVELKKTTGIGLSKKLGEDPARVDAALKFLKFWFSEEGGKQWILLTRSPMGVKVDLDGLSGVDPLLLAFLGVPDRADVVYTLPNTKAMQERGWDDCCPDQQTSQPRSCRTPRQCKSVAGTI